MKLRLHVLQVELGTDAVQRIKAFFVARPFCHLAVMDSTACWFPLVTMALALGLGPKTRKARKKKVKSKRKSKGGPRQPMMRCEVTTGQVHRPTLPTHSINGDLVSSTSGLGDKFFLACRRKISDFFSWSALPRQEWTKTGI